MKILLITSSFQRAAGLFLPDFIRSLGAQGCVVHVLTQNCRENRTVHERLWDGCDVTFFAWRGGESAAFEVFQKGLAGFPIVAGYFAHGLSQGRRIMRAFRPDVIFAEWLVPAGLLAAALARLHRVPYAVRALGSDILIAGRKAAFKPVVAYVARNAAARFADGFDLCRRTSAMAGGRECLFAATTRRLSQERTGYAPLEDAGRFVTCSVGRLHHMKGQDLQIEAAALLRQRGLAFRTYLVGSGIERENWARRIRELGLENDVIMTGGLPDGDVRTLLAHSDCVVISSRSESIPLAMGEAVAAGRPLVCTDVGDMGELITRYQLGQVVPQEDPRALADALVAMAREPARERFAERGHELLELLSMEKTTATILGELSRIVASKGKAQ